MSDTLRQETLFVADRKEAVAILEVSAIVLYLMAYIWIIEPRSRSYALPGIFLFFFYTLFLHVRHKDRAADLGIRFDTFGRALLEALVVIVPALILAASFGVRLGGGADFDARRTALAFFWGYPWALFQEYGLQCVIGRRLSEAIPGEIAHDLACAAIFGALHLPNPFLTVVTFGAGYCFCALFRRCPNLFVLALAHTLASTVLYHFLPLEITHSMRVGPGFFGSRGH